MRCLKWFKIGYDFNLWVCQFYNDMVEKKLHQHFTYDDESKEHVKRIETKKRVPLQNASNQGQELRKTYNAMTESLGEDIK